MCPFIVTNLVYQMRFELIEDYFKFIKKSVGNLLNIESIIVILLEF